VASGAGEHEIFEILDAAGYEIFIVPSIASPEDVQRETWATRLQAPNWGACHACDHEARLSHSDCS
jgi:hypothetical protein